MPDLFVPRREPVQAHEDKQAFALFPNPFILMGLSRSRTSVAQLRSLPAGPSIRNKR
jgi:hypothetical protein